MRSAAPCTLLLLSVIACDGSRDVFVPDPLDGGPRQDSGMVASYIIDGTDIAALNDCYSPERLFGGGLDDPPNCATECGPTVPRGLNRYVCGSFCAANSLECQNTDWTAIVWDKDHAAACDPDLAAQLRHIGVEVPIWPMKRCDAR